MFKIYKSKYTCYDYNKITPGYYLDIMLNGSPVQSFWHKKKFLTIANKIAAGSDVLDYGCGSGGFLYILAKTYESIKAVGVDVAKEQICYARKHVVFNNQNKSISFLQVGNKDPILPFNDNSFDFVTSIEVFEHLHPYDGHKRLVDIQRVLKKDGRLLVTTPNYKSPWPIIERGLNRISPVKYQNQHINKFTPNSFIKFIESAGYEICEVSTLYLMAPFTAVISVSLANSLHTLERKANSNYGCIIIVEAKKIDTTKV